MTDPTRDPPGESERTIVLRESRAPGGPVYVWDDDAEVSIFELLRPLVRHRWTILVAAVSVAGAAALFSLTRPATYTSTAKFVPQTETPSSLASISGLAAQFGVDVGTSEPGESPEFYAQLLETDRILEEAVRTPYALEDTTGEEARRLEGDLVELLNVEGETPGIRLARAREILREEILDVDTDRDTGMVTLSVHTHSPALSAAIGGRLLELLNEFNLETRQSQAMRQREFVEARQEEALLALQTAEDSLQRFLERTRRVETSPTLIFQRDRLRRQVELREQVYSSVAQAYQQARIDEVRDTPVLTIVDRATPPATPDGARLPLVLTLGLLLGGMVGAAVAYGRHFLDRPEDEGDEEYELFRRDLREATKGPRRVARRVRSLIPGTARERDTEAR